MLVALAGDISSPASIHRPTSVVELYVAYLRKKLDQKGEPFCIRMVRGVGYTFDQRALEALETLTTDKAPNQESGGAVFRLRLPGG